MELIDAIEEAVQYGLILVTIIGLVLDIACYKWIRIAHALIYVEILYTIILAMIPFEQGIAAS